MRYFVGTSGYSYKEWKGSFYPEKLPQKAMLGFYAERFSTVEMNNTFYRMPKVSDLASWAEQVPDSFRFAIKAPQTITHRKRLNNADEITDDLLNSLSTLKAKQGPLLFQLPPNFKKDLSRLNAFLDIVGSRALPAFEFRHESWFDSEVFGCLRAHSCALCSADTDETPDAELVSTTSWAYLRLRRENYTDGQLGKWIEKLNRQNLREAYVFFKHEDAGTGPKFAARFLELAGS